MATYLDRLIDYDTGIGVHGDDWPRDWGPDRHD